MLKIMNCSIVALPLFIALGVTSYGASTTVAFDTGDHLINDFLGAPLSGGNATINGDGFAIQLGYYTGSNAGSNFAGTWVPLTGSGSFNSAFASVSIGDDFNNGAGDGSFAFTFVFDPAASGRNTSLPSAGQVLSVRFYDASSPNSATYFNAVSNDAWLWLAPADPSSNVTISLNDSGLEWQGGVSSAFKTTVALAPIPEPSTAVAFAGLAAVGFTASRRRQRIAA